MNKKRTNFVRSPITKIRKLVSIEEVSNKRDRKTKIETEAIKRTAVTIRRINIKYEVGKFPPLDRFFIRLFKTFFAANNISVLESGKNREIWSDGHLESLSRTCNPE